MGSDSNSLGLRNARGGKARKDISQGWFLIKIIEMIASMLRSFLHQMVILILRLPTLLKTHIQILFHFRGNATLSCLRF
jgi:hypothetical protein